MADLFSNSLRRKAENRKNYHAKNKSQNSIMSYSKLGNQKYNSTSNLNRTNSNSLIKKSRTTIKQDQHKNEALQKFSEEIKHIRSCCEALNNELAEHCLISSEKNEFEKIKKENIKLLADVSILKEDMNDIMKKYSMLNMKVNQLENENEMLRNQNKKLLSFIGSCDEGSKINYNVNNNLNSGSDLMFSSSINTSNQRGNDVITEMSAFNNAGSNNNMNNNYNNFTTTMNNDNDESCNTGVNKSNITNLTALAKMNQTLTRTMTPIKSKRYLIPKKDD